MIEYILAGIFTALVISTRFAPEPTLATEKVVSFKLTQADCKPDQLRIE